MKDKKGITITNASQKFLKQSNRREVKSKGRKGNKIWIEKGSEFYNRSMKSFLQNENIEMHSTYKEGKSVVAEIFVRTLKNNKYMSSISKNVCLDKLNDIDNRYNNTYNRTIKMKPVDVKSSMYIDSSKEINDKDPKFKIGDIVRISK